MINEKKQQAIDKVMARRKKLAEILKKYPEVDPENAWHTLILLEKSPWERLKLGLIRGRGKK